MRRKFWIAIVAFALSLSACNAARLDQPAPETLDDIEAELRQHVEILASDEFEGRRPGTDGERKTLRYLADTWEAAGLISGTNDPAHPWLAPVELAVRAPETATMKFRTGSRVRAVPDGQVKLFTSGRRALLADAPILFVGTQGSELEPSVLTGKVALMIWDHPARERQRTALLANGAAAVLAIVLESAEFDQLAGIREKGTYRLAGSEGGAQIDGFMSEQAAFAIFGVEQIRSLFGVVESPAFRPKLLNVTADMEVASAAGAVRTHNLIAKLPGANPDGEAVLLLAHWDHFGRCGRGQTTDLICSGAVDNASGLAVLSGIAKRLAAGPKLDRDVYFVATTAEEWGLLGAIAFTRDPPIPLDSIVAAFNIDTIGVAPRGSPVAIVGAGLTPLDAQIEAIAGQLGRDVIKDQFAAGFIQRQDGWILLQRDVPSLMVSSAFAQPELMGRYTKDRYHRPTDRVASVELGGAAEDMLLHIALVRHFASLPSQNGPAI
ncbi:M28 family metallopeptidase [Pontixanthobacter gangjinensis]|uniref:M28 family peptidase n=1 Tax=Pontixanthobacter gangjinensis TaxID=1028742 RepID=A0A6I4SLQ5_9SPHN|nr:M28 family peptidase [Pontixanthobacter gangjinensis]MXO56821.1 M28 family peptidase [Pontixanthobacter gangjinensis]